VNRHGAECKGKYEKSPKTKKRNAPPTARTTCRGCRGDAESRERARERARAEERKSVAERSSGARERRAASARTDSSRGANVLPSSKERRCAEQTRGHAREMPLEQKRSMEK
jgi:hypothetical protein